MIWTKQGKIFNSINVNDTIQNYAQNPNAVIMADRLRIYFTCRPKKDTAGNFVSYTTFIDVDKKNPDKILYVHDKPVLELGGLGEFDQFGIMPGSLVHIEENNEVWLYYVGWTRMQAVPYNWTVGLAISYDGGVTFKKYSKGPILGANANEPYLQACPRVYRRSKKEWIMWYQSGTKWNDDNGHKESVYVTMFASSEDGINWERAGKQVIPSKYENECQTSASLLELDNKYHMFFSYRHGLNFRNSDRGYRIGYAWSDDLVNWHRDDLLTGIDTSESGWDSEMVCYPHVIKVEDKIIMFYCGNYFGRDGFGYATLEKNK